MAQRAPSLSGADAAKLVTGAAGALEALGALAVVFFIGVYGAATPDAYARVIVALVPLRRRERTRLVLFRDRRRAHAVALWPAPRDALRRRVRRRRARRAARAARRAALAPGRRAETFVEYLGAVASAAPAMLMAFTKGPMLTLVVAAIFTCVHLVEGYFLTPLLARRMVHLAPAYTLGAQVILASIFGVFGVTFATPLLVVLTILVRRLYVEDALGDRLAGSGA